MPTALTRWLDHHHKATFVPSFESALAGLAPEQAAWKPGPDRHSIRQIVHHLVFWREVVVRVRRGGFEPAEDEIARRNWPESLRDPPAEPESAWRDALAAFDASRDSVADALRDGVLDEDTGLELLIHDGYHLGQIMQLRAMLGLPPTG